MKIKLISCDRTFGSIFFIQCTNSENLISSLWMLRRRANRSSKMNK